MRRYYSEKGQRIVEAQEARRRDVTWHKIARRARSHARVSRGELPHFTVSDFVLVAWVRKSGPQAKLLSRWTRPWRVILDDREHVYTIQHLVSGETRDAHVVCMRLYADKELEMTRRVTEVFQYLEHQLQYLIARIGEVRRRRPATRT